MIRSIRTFLLVNLLLSAVVVTSVAIIGNIFLGHRDFHSHLDSQLSMSAYTIRAFMHNEGDQPRPFTAESVRNIQEEIDNIPFYSSFDTNDSDMLHELKNYASHTQFVVWNPDNAPILSTSFSPLPKPDTIKPGFSDVWNQSAPYRAFMLRDPQTNIRIVVMQEYKWRIQLENRITRDSIITMAITLPFLGLLIWIIVGQGLSGLDHTRREIMRREPNKLTAITIPDLPQEIEPLVGEMNSLFSRLQDAFERERRFAGDAAHELITPLAALSSHAQVAHKTCDEEVRHRALERILRGIDRATHVVRQLLTLSRTYPEAATTPMERVNLNAIIEDVIADLIVKALEKNQSIEFLPETEAMMTLCYPTAVAIMARNLIINAVHYTPEGSTITVQTFCHQQKNHLMVTDNGNGLSDDDKKRVLERFYRVIGNQVNGSGLGLNIVQQIVKLHHANIDIRDPKNHPGLEIDITFPPEPESEV